MGDNNALFKEVLHDELGLEGENPIKDFIRTLGAADDEKGMFQYFNQDYTENEIENWQIISPVNGWIWSERNQQILFKPRF